MKTSIRPLNSGCLIYLIPLNKMTRNSLIRDSRRYLTCVQLAVGTTLGHTLETFCVLIAVPHTKLLSSRQSPTHAKVNMFTVLERTQVSLALL